MDINKKGGHEDKIIEAFKEKDNFEIKTTNSWQIFKIMAEFVEGFEKLGKIGPCVSILGQLDQNQKIHSISWLKILHID